MVYHMMFYTVHYAIQRTLGADKYCLRQKIRRTILDAWGWCTGTTQRDGMGREEGGGFRMGNTCIPVVEFILIFGKTKTVM